MKYAYLSSSLLVCALTICGCPGTGRLDPSNLSALGPAKDVVSESFATTGGVTAWNNLRNVQAQLVLTVYDAEGRKQLYGADVVIDPRAGHLTATGAAPGGEWRAEVQTGRGGWLRGGGFDKPARTRLLAALGLVNHRFRGPWNLLESREKPTSAKPVRVDGRDLVRVGVQADPTLSVAYYFDQRGSLLRMVTAGGDAPGSNGTVTVYDYQRLDNGMTLPSMIRLVRIGPDLLVGSQTIWEAEFTDMRTR